MTKTRLRSGGIFTGVMLAFMLLATCFAAAQTNPASTPAAAQPAVEYKPTPAEAELIQLSREWMDAALVKGDMKRTEELMAPEYTLQGFDASRAPQPRAAWLGLLTSGGLKVKEFTYTSINAKVYGDLGIVYATFRWSGQMRGAYFQDTGLTVDVWQRREGKWQVVSRRSAGQAMLERLKKPTEAKER